MMGQVKLDIYLKSGDINRYVVDSISGWDYSGNYLLVHTPDGKTVPYYFGDIVHFFRTASETVH